MMLTQIKNHFVLAQERMKTNADKHRRELVFEDGRYGVSQTSTISTAISGEEVVSKARCKVFWVI